MFKKPESMEEYILQVQEIETKYEEEFAEHGLENVEVKMQG